VAFGVSAIGDMGGAFVQNHRKLSNYERIVEEGTLPIERGYVLSDDDKIRRHVITALMCNFRLETAEVERLFGIDFAAYFENEIVGLEALAKDGFVELHDLGTPEGRIDVVELGRLFVRNVAMLFDTYLKAHEQSETPRFSRTV
jgi:oxygen-independent coproporphyrinogen-3 oxidase